METAHRRKLSSKKKKNPLMLDGIYPVTDFKKKGALRVGIGDDEKRDGGFLRLL